MNFLPKNRHIFRTNLTNCNIFYSKGSSEGGFDLKIHGASHTESILFGIVHGGCHQRLATIHSEDFSIEWQHPVSDTCRDNADSRSGKDIIQPMAAIIQAHKCHSRSHRICRNSVAQAILRTHELRTGKGRGRMPRRERVASPRIGSFFTDGIFNIAFSGLNAALDRHGKITLPDIFDLSRHWKMPEESPEKRSVCFKLTNSSSSLEIDRQYPGVLSCGYFTVGHPRHTIYVPIPVCAEKLHPALSDLTWSKAAWARFDSLGLSEPFPVKWQEFESSSFERFTRAKEEARKLLDSGKRDEAVKLLNMTAYAIWEEAAAILLPRK